MGQAIPELLGELPLESAYSAAKAEETALTGQIADTERRMSALAKQEARKAQLDKLIPQKEAELTAAAAALTDAKEKTAGLTASLAELTAQIDTLRAKLTFSGKAAVLAEKAALEKQFAEFKAKGLKLDMSRGKPAPEQLNLSLDMLLHCLDGDYKSSNGIDCRNYGVLDGIKEAKELIADSCGRSPQRTWRPWRRS